MSDAKHPATLGELFEHQPTRPAPPGAPWTPPWQWGNRGDPYLWSALREHFATTALPATADELNEQLAAAFAALTGRSLDEPAAFFVPGFAHGGMTSGYVLPSWWRERGFPFVRERWRAAHDR